MKAAILMIIGCLTVLLSGYTFADCNDEGCSEGICNPYESYCQCTDPMCNRPQYSDCISRAYCCEAFGNVGAR